MKKILCMLIALACVFSIVACDFSGGNSNDDPKTEIGNPLEKVVSASKPTKVVSQVKYLYPESHAFSKINFDGFYSLEIDGEDSIFSYDYKVPATVEEAADGPVKPVSGKIYVKGGKISTDGDEWEVVSPETVTHSLNLLKNRFKTYEKSADEKTLTATITAENLKSVIGYSLAADGDISFVLKTDGIFLRHITISYKSTSGAEVSIDTSYTYNDITLDFPA